MKKDRLRSNLFQVLISSTALIIFSKLVGFVARLTKTGHGSTWPGEIALTLRPNFIERVVKKNPHLKIILVVGTNGKTTSVKLLSHILRKKGLRVFSNTSGANLLNGVASSLIDNATMIGRITKDVAIFEIDENALPHVIDQFSPTAILVLNLFRDQLDRYGEIDTIVSRWERAFARLSEEVSLILNGQDPNIFFLGQRINRNNVHYFGLAKDKLKKGQISLEADVVHCPTCSSKLHYLQVAYSHQGIFSCPKCGSNETIVQTFSSINNPLQGIFNEYNIAGVSLLCRVIFDISSKELNEALSDFRPAFGRQELLNYEGRKILLQLSKNPVGFNQSIDLIMGSDDTVKNVLLILNDASPDGRDVSWIWDVDFENLVGDSTKIWISGKRAFDMAIRIKYALREMSQYSENREAVDKFFVSENLNLALADSIKQTQAGETIFILPVYSAMLEVRKIIAGQAIRSGE